MKTNLASLLTTFALAASALAHGDVELGPNGGRLLEFSKNESMHGEVTLKDGKFHIAILDKDQKPVALAAGIGLVPLVLAADQPGKEILHPVAVVIVGGLITSTLLGLGVTPTVFYTFGRRAAAQAIANEAPASH